MTDDVLKDLGQETQELSPFHQKMLTEAKELVKMSRSKMSSYYGQWDQQDAVYRGEMSQDTDDIEQARKGKPGKIVIPNTHAQVMTFVSFLFLTYRQNSRTFELSPTSPSAYGTLQEDSETLLDRDMRFNAENQLMFQNLLDIARFGPGIQECSWTKKISRIYVPQEAQVATVGGVEVSSNPDSEWEDVLKYEGNLLRNVSPYRFFPDTRHPLVDFQKGEFCGAEEDYSRGALFELESSGEVTGIDHITPMTGSDFADRGVGRMSFDSTSRNYMSQWESRSKSAPVVVTKLQRWIVPSKYIVDEESKKKLGPEDFPILYHVWYANDQRLIRLEPCRWWHNEFGWTVSQFTPDMHQTLAMGLADLVYRLQDVISWFINSRIRDVRRNVFGRNVVDPRVIDTATLDGEGDIYIRKGMSTPIDRAIYPLPMNNVTQGHMGDADILTKIMQTVTGVNDNMMGQVNSGRRSAREVGITAGGAAGRMKMHAQLIWESGYGRLGRLMFSNQRQALSYESFLACLGDDSLDPMTGQSVMQPRYDAFKSTPKKVALGADYFVFDSVSQSEKSFLANNLGQILQLIMSNPQAALALDIDPKEIFDQQQLLLGTGPMKRFSLAAKQQYMQQLAQSQAIMTPPAGPPNAA